MTAYAFIDANEAGDEDTIFSHKLELAFQRTNCCGLLPIVLYIEPLLPMLTQLKLQVVAESRAHWDGLVTVEVLRVTQA